MQDVPLCATRAFGRSCSPIDEIDLPLHKRSRIPENWNLIIRIFTVALSVFRGVLHEIFLPNP